MTSTKTALAMALLLGSTGSSRYVGWEQQRPRQADPAKKRKRKAAQKARRKQR